MRIRWLTLWTTIWILVLIILLWSLRPWFRHRRYQRAYLESLDAVSTFKSDPDTNLTLDSYSVIFGGRAPAPGFGEWLQMAKREQCATSLHTYAQIYEDLGPWFRVGRIDPASLFALAASTTLKHKAYKKDGSDQFYYMLHELFAAGNVMPFRYLENLSDEPIVLPATDAFFRTRYATPKQSLAHNTCLRNTYANVSHIHSIFTHPITFLTQNTLAPVISQCKLRCYADILMPMAMHHLRIAAEKRVQDNVPWEDKRDVLFWRGATNDGWHTPRMERGHRVRLVEWAEQYEARHPGSTLDVDEDGDVQSGMSNRTRVDFGFYEFRQCEPKSHCKALQTRYKKKSFVPFNETLKFKYLIVVDGNTWPNRLQTYLESNSVVLYNGIFFDWNIGQLKPWVHYVPVRLDLADLEEKLDWLKSNDDKARKISENARRLMHGLNDWRQMKCYIGLLFLEYSRLYNA